MPPPVPSLYRSQQLSASVGAAVCQGDDDVSALEAQKTESGTSGTWRLGVRARLLLAFFGISAFAILAAVAGNYAFNQVGNRIELIEARVPRVVSSMEISRAADRLMASTPALLAATTTKEYDEVSQRMRPEIDRLANGLNNIERTGLAAGTATTIRTLVTSLQSNLAELENLIGQRLKTRERLSVLLRELFQSNQDTQRLFAPWFQVMEMQVSRFFGEPRKGDIELGTEAGKELATSIVRDRSAQTAQRDYSAVVEQLIQTATNGEKTRLPVISFQVSRGLDDLETKAKDLDPKLRTLFIDQVVRVRKLAIGPDAILTIRGQELDLIGRAEKLVAENSNLSAQLDSAVNRLVLEAETDVASSTENALSLQRLSARILLLLAAFSLIGSALIVWLYVGRNLIRRLMGLSDGMLAIVAGNYDQPIDVSGSDEVAAMGRTVEVFRKNTLERDALLAERAQAADRLEQQVKERTGELAQSVEELRALGQVTQAVNSTVDLQTVLNTIVAKATQLSNTEAGAIYVFDDARQEFRLQATYGLSDEIVAEIKERNIRLGQTAISEAVEQRKPIQIADIQQDPAAAIDAIVRAGFRALLLVPLLGTDRIVGALVVRRKQPGEFSKSAIELLQTFAAQSVLAIQNAELFERVEARTRELAISLEDLRNAQDRLVQTEKLASLGQLTAGIAHEIKNPLNFVNNFSGVSVELIDELQESLAELSLNEKRRAEITGLTDTLRSNLGKVVQHGKRADAIVKNMLLHSREASGEHRPVDINALVEEGLNLAYHGARAEKQDFNIKLEKSFDPTAGEADVFPQDITRVLLNLISNGFYAAIKRAEEINGGGYEPTLTAATKNLGDHVEITIRDNGAGMAPDVKVKIFNPFFTTKPAGEGTGLGLSITHDIIVKQHGGSIEVDTQPGEFTEIRVILPRAAAVFPERL